MPNCFAPLTLEMACLSEAINPTNHARVVIEADSPHNIVYTSPGASAALYSHTHRPTVNRQTQQTPPTLAPGFFYITGCLRFHLVAGSPFFKRLCGSRKQYLRLQSRIVRSRHRVMAWVFLADPYARQPFCQFRALLVSHPILCDNEITHISMRLIRVSSSKYVNLSSIRCSMGSDNVRQPHHPKPRTL